MSETVKIIIEIPKATYEDLKSGKIYSSLCEAPQGLVEGIRNGTPLDSDSERAEVQAYFAGQTYGWEQGRKALIEEVKAEIEKMPCAMLATHFYIDQDSVLQILDNIGKGGQRMRTFAEVQDELRECINHAYRGECEDVQKFGSNVEHLDKAMNRLNELIEIHNAILGKISAEIKDRSETEPISTGEAIGMEMALDIIDKYKGDSE